MTHPDPDVLAEFQAGLVTGRRGGRISAHLAGCERCAGLCDELAEVSALLAAVPAPAMPDTVAQRLEGVLAAETVQRHDSERAVGDSSRHRAANPRPRRHWNSRPVALRVLAPAAAVVVLAAGGYGLSRVVSGSTRSQASAGSASHATSVPGAGTLPSTGSTSRHGNGPQIEAPVKFEVVTSRTDYHRATLQQQLERELLLHPQVAGSAQELAPGPVKECVLQVTAHIRAGTLVLVETARFQGQPANVIVAVSGDHDAAWVTTPACSSASDHVLATATLPGTSAS